MTILPIFGMYSPADDITVWVRPESMESIEAASSLVWGFPRSLPSICTSVSAAMAGRVGSNALDARYVGEMQGTGILYVRWGDAVLVLSADVMPDEGQMRVIKEKLAL